MPDVSRTPVIASERMGIVVRRDGELQEMPAAQREHVHRGLEKLVRAGLSDDDYDVHGTEPVTVRVEQIGPGAYDFVTTMHDARPLLRRITSPRSAASVTEAAALVRNAVETVLSGVEIIPIIMAARTVRMGTLLDDAGLVPMVTDDRFVMRVPWSIFRILEASADARAGADEIKHIFEQDGTSITLVRGKGATERHSESVLELPAGLWERVRDADMAAVLGSVEFVEEPLQGLVTRSQRDELPRASQRDVGPERTGRREVTRMPPPGPQI